MSILDLIKQNRGLAQRDTIRQIDAEEEKNKDKIVAPIGEKEVKEALHTLKEYKAGKEALEARIVENEEWWRGRHWRTINRKGTGTTYEERTLDADGNPVTVTKQKRRVEPVSAWLQNVISNKHADVMDNFPAPNILARERSDEESANRLSSIVPVVLERCRFEDIFSENAWDFIKNGVSAYGVFWDSTAENGLGDISISNIDILNIYWQPGISDIDESENLFIVNLADNKALEAKYPELEHKLGGNQFLVKEYIYDDTINNQDKSVVVDWYYRKNIDGKAILHYCKFVNDVVLYSSENEGLTDGFYNHGKYPVIISSLFPVKSSPAGFGYIDLGRDPQMYIDKLNQIILENAFLAGKPRWFKKANMSINEEEYADWSKTFVTVNSGTVDDDNLRQIAINPLPGYIVNHLDHKIEELKETSANRDFNNGGSGSGVTAASAIAALQEAGNKQSRDLIKNIYRSYREVVYQTIELIRQFYDEMRQFRITGKTGKPEYIDFSNNQILPQNTDGNAIRVPVFDIEVRAERNNPFSKAANNDFAKELYSMGFFNAGNADMALGALELMDFDGKQKVLDRINQGQTMFNMIQQQQIQIQQMAKILEYYGILGANGMEPQQTGETVQGAAPSLSQDKMAALANGETTRTSYADQLAERSKA